MSRVYDTGALRHIGAVEVFLNCCVAVAETFVPPLKQHDD